MYFPFLPENHDAILRHYDENGFAVLTGVDPRIADILRSVIGG